MCGCFLIFYTSHTDSRASIAGLARPEPHTTLGTTDWSFALLNFIALGCHTTLANVVAQSRHLLGLGLQVRARRGGRPH